MKIIRLKVGTDVRNCTIFLARLIIEKKSVLKLVPLAIQVGFYWEGHYNNRLDGIHFEEDGIIYP